MSRQLATVLLGVGALFVLSSFLLQIQINRLAWNDFASQHRVSMKHISSRIGRRRHPITGITTEKDTTGSSQRREYEITLDPDVIESSVTKMRLSTLPTSFEKVPYDMYRCPPKIPKGYPIQWNILNVLSNWNPDNMTIPFRIYQGICVLDWKDMEQRRLAEVYREAELPFLIQNHPEIWKTAERWSHYDYLNKLLGGDGDGGSSDGGTTKLYRNEHSKDNHMPYWKLRHGIRKPDGWVPPTENVELSFPDWYSKAIELEDKTTIVNHEHYYFRLNGAYQDKMNSFLYDELPFFLPTKKSFFMPEPKEQRGINCRFGSKGIIAETHYDYSRNFIVILKGRKRYILAHPDQCPNLELYKMGHPSGRHSSVDWSNPEEWKTGRFPQAQVNEVIVQAGDALYLPTAWFHFIVSLNHNYQCNSRSGITEDYRDAITRCGFPTSR